jgi:DNA polymerase
MDSKQFKQQLLEQLYAPYKNCTLCPLGTQGRTQVVFGEGNPDAQIIFIGEGPGAKEDQQGRPFVGRSGQLLTRTLQHLGITRETVFITNVVKCRPPNNRPPTPIESNTCKNLLLLKQIKIIRPKILCTLGSSALQSLLDQTAKITKLRGNPLQWQNITLIPTYHPAYILRNPRELPTFVQDIKTALDSLNKS